jgi:ABC-2 type transport system ATP-binding protein
MNGGVDVDGVVKRYGAFEAVKGISFSVAPGEIFGLLGPNGAGKSTLIRMMTTLIPITRGRVLIQGFDLARHPDEVRRRIGVLPQAMTSDLDLTVEENLVIYAQLYGVKRPAKRIDELLEAVELTEWRKAMTRALSGGMRRRLEIARGLIHEPKVFFLDEPTTGLDPVSRVRVWDLLTRINREQGITILLSTHYMDEADALCGRVAIVDRGQLAALDTPAALKARVPGGTVIEAVFQAPPEGWEQTLRDLPEVTEVSRREGAYLLRTRDGSRTLMALTAGPVELRAITVKPTSLDDVFVHFAGHGLEEKQVRP